MLEFTEIDYKTDFIMNKNDPDLRAKVNGVFDVYIQRQETLDQDQPYYILSVCVDRKTLIHKTYPDKEIAKQKPLTLIRRWLTEQNSLLRNTDTNKDLHS